jgi:hypothetical protein
MRRRVAHPIHSFAEAQALGGASLRVLCERVGFRECRCYEILTSTARVSAQDDKIWDAGRKNPHVSRKERARRGAPGLMVALISPWGDGAPGCVDFGVGGGVWLRTLGSGGESTGLKVGRVSGAADAALHGAEKRAFNRQGR